jgi:hypothetical protein
MYKLELAHIVLETDNGFEVRINECEFETAADEQDFVRVTYARCKEPYIPEVDLGVYAGLQPAIVAARRVANHLGSIRVAGVIGTYAENLLEKADYPAKDGTYAGAIRDFVSAG